MKKKIAKLLASVLTLALLVALFPAVPAAAEGYKTISIDDAMPTATQPGVVVDAGQTLTIELVHAAKYVLTIKQDDITVTYKDVAYDAANGEVVVFLSGNGEYSVMEITNNSTQQKTMDLKFRRFDGHMRMPIELERMDDMVIEQLITYEYGMDTGMYFRWTAPSAGTLVLDATKVESDYNMLATVSIGDDAVSNNGILSYDVEKGEQLKIRVVALREAPYNTPMDATIHLDVDFSGTQPDGAPLGVFTPVPENLTEGRSLNPTDPEPTNPTDPSEPEEPSNPFTDVFEGKFYYDAVLWAVDNEVTTGKTATTFAPNEDCTRGQVVTFLWRAKGEPEPTSTNNPFQDTDEEAYYYKAMLWAVENGITKGISDNQFAPNKQCSRAEVVTFLWRAVGSPEADNQTHPFTDVTVGRFYYQAMLWAVENGVTEGVKPTAFAPDAICNRGQTVTFLYRAVAK